MRKNIAQRLLMLFLFFVLALVATNASAAYSAKQVWARFQATAGETLTAGNVVMMKDADGYVYKADANDAALRPAVGIIGKGGATGTKVEVIAFGIMTGWTGLSEGVPGYLSETAAAVTQSAPAYSQQVGYAISSTDYVVAFQNYFDSSALTVLGTLSGATPLVLEGATADEVESTIAITDPTVGDQTWTIPDLAANSSVAYMASTLPTNAPNAANSVWGASNALVYEGATANEFETSVAPTDPTADRSIAWPDASGTAILSSLATNAPDAANGVWGASNALVYEGATANEFETSVAPTDPTADRSIAWPDASGTAILSSLATNAPEAANGVWGASNATVYEGATANDFETSVTPTDPTADRTIAWPDASGTANLNCTATHDYGAAAVDWTLTVAEMQCGAISVTNANGAINAILPSAVPGKTYTIINGSGQTVTFKVSGQTGGTVATAKWALYTTIAADVAEVYELP